jgi:hypothetical protein
MSGALPFTSKARTTLRETGSSSTKRRAFGRDEDVTGGSIGRDSARTAIRAEVD